MNDETSIDFLGPFEKAANAKKNLIVSIDDESSRPEAKFLRNPTIDNVTEFLHNHMALFWVSRRIKTNPARRFVRSGFVGFVASCFLSILSSR